MHILITHGFSDSNKGDLAIGLGTILGFRQLDSQADITVHSVFLQADPDFNFHGRFLRKFGVSVAEGLLPAPYVESEPPGVRRKLLGALRLFKSVVWFGVFWFIPPLARLFSGPQVGAFETLKSTDLVVVKGGQFIYNDGTALKNLIFLWRTLMPIRLATRLGRPTVILGQSIGPVMGKRAKKMVSKTLRRCDLIVARERKTVQLLESLGISENVRMAPDMAFLIEPDRAELSEDLLNWMNEGPSIGVTVVLRQFSEPALKPVLERYRQALLKVCEDVFRKLGRRIVFFPQVTSKYMGASDLDLIQELVEELNRRDVPARCIEGDLSPQQLSFLYGKCEVLLGTRLHSCILAACAATPIVAIRYHGNKTEGVMAELGLEKFVHDIFSLDAESITADIGDAIAARKGLSEHISKRVDVFRSEILSVLSDCLNLTGKTA